MKKGMGLGGSLKKSSSVFFTSPLGFPFIRNQLHLLHLPWSRLPWLLLPASAVTQAACSPTLYSAFIHARKAFSPSENSHRCLIQMRRASFKIMLRLSDNNYSSTWKHNARVSLWSLHWFLDLNLHRECHKFTLSLKNRYSTFSSEVPKKECKGRGQGEKEKQHIHVARQLPVSGTY